MRGIIAVEAPPTCGEIEHVRQGEERMPVGQRLGVGDVECEAQPAATAPRRGSPSVSATLPRAMFTTSAPSGRAERKSVVDESGRRLGQRHADDDDLGGRAAACGSSSMPWMRPRSSSRARLATRVSSTSNGASRSSIALPTPP